VRVVVGEDQLLMRQGIVAVLRERGLEVVGEAGTLPELMRTVREARPDVAVVDVRMPPTHTDEGLKAAAAIRSELPGTAVLLLTQYVEADFVIGLLEGDRSGIGYLLKDHVLDPGSFVDYVERVVAGECVVDPSLVRELIDRQRARDPLEALTPREREVLSLLAEGLTNAGIAARLVLSERTVEVHVAQVFAKLGLSDDPSVNKRVLAVITALSAG